MDSSPIMCRVLVTDTVDEDLIEGLKKNGYTVDYHPRIPLAEVHQISIEKVAEITTENAKKLFRL